MSSLDLALGDIISQNRTKSGRRGAGKPRADGDASANGNSASGPMRHGRRQRRDDPYARPSNGGSQQRESSRAAPRQERQSAMPRAQMIQRVIGDTIRVSNLAQSTTEEDLRYIFDKIGTIINVQIFYNAQGQCTGTAEVCFSTNAAADEAARQLDQAEVDGRIMLVNVIGTIVQSSLPQVQRRRDEPRRERDQSQRRSEAGRSERVPKKGNAPAAGGEKKPRQAKAPRGEKKETNVMDLDAEL